MEPREVGEQDSACVQVGAWAVLWLCSLWLIAVPGWPAVARVHANPS